MTRTKELGCIVAILAVAGPVAAVQGYFNLRESAEVAAAHPTLDAKQLQSLLLFEVGAVFLTIAFNYGYFIIRRIAGLAEAEIFRVQSMEFLILQQVIAAVFVAAVRGYLILGEHSVTPGTLSALFIAAIGLYRAIKSKIKGSYRNPKMGFPSDDA